jgi:hypothetical protein
MAVARVAVQGFGMQHELPAFGRGGWRSDRHLAAELVGGTGLAFADALHLGRVQRVDLRSALTLLLTLISSTSLAGSFFSMNSRTSAPT